MQKIIGIIAIVIGVMLIVWGHDAAQSLSSQYHIMMTGNPTQRAMLFYAAGAALTIYGLFLTFWRWR